MKISPALVYTTGHFLNERMSLSLGIGFQAKRKPACARVVTEEGHKYVPVSPSETHCSIVYGILRGTGDILKSCEEKGLDYLYCDHSFFGATRAGTGGQNYYRLVPNGRYYTDLGDMPGDRWATLGLQVKPWRKTGDHVVIVPVSKFVAAYNGFDAHDWLAETYDQVKSHTDRPIVVKPKDSERPLASVLENAWALVTMESNAAVDAVLSGIPVFTSPQAAASRVGSTDLSELETPAMPDRAQHLANLAYQQWTVEEIRSGRAKAVLREQISQREPVAHAAVPQASGVLTVDAAAAFRERAGSHP